MAEVAAMNAPCSSIVTAVRPGGCKIMNTPVIKLATARNANSAPSPRLRIAQPMTRELLAEPTAFSSNTDDPIVTNSSRLELSAALAKETA